MPDTIISRNLIVQIEKALQRAALVTSLDHPGMVGTVREIMLADLIRPLLPDGFRAGTSKIVDRQGKLSPQADIVIYNRSAFSPLMFDETTGVFPMDAVYYVIEVKSRLSATEIKDSIAKAEAIQKLDGRRPMLALFGFDSDTSNPKTDLDRVSSLQPKPPQAPALHIYCSVGRGYAFFRDAGWNRGFTTEKHAEVVGFLMGIINSLVKMREAPNPLEPGHYLAWWTDADLDGPAF